MLDQPTTETEKPISVSSWMLTLLLTFIPIVNIIMYLVWAFGDGSSASKRNWARASLLWFLIVIVLGVLFSLIFGAAAFTIFQDMEPV